MLIYDILLLVDVCVDSVASCLRLVDTKDIVSELPLSASTPSHPHPNPSVPLLAKARLRLYRMSVRNLSGGAETMELQAGEGSCEK